MPSTPGAPPSSRYLALHNQALGSSSPSYNPSYIPDDDQWLKSTFGGTGSGVHSSQIMAENPSLGTWQGLGHNTFQPILVQSRSEHCWVDQKGLPHRFRHAERAIFEPHNQSSADQVTEGFKAICLAVEEVRTALQATQVGTALSLQNHQASGDNLVGVITKIGEAVVTLQGATSENTQFLGQFTAWFPSFEATVNSLTPQIVSLGQQLQSTKSFCSTSLQSLEESGAQHLDMIKKLEEKVAALEAGLGQIKASVVEAQALGLEIKGGFTALTSRVSAIQATQEEIRHFSACSEQKSTDQNTVLWQEVNQINSVSNDQKSKLLLLESKSDSLFTELVQVKATLLDQGQRVQHISSNLASIPSSSPTPTATSPSSCPQCLQNHSKIQALEANLVALATENKSSMDSLLLMNQQLSQELSAEKERIGKIWNHMFNLPHQSQHPSLNPPPSPPHLNPHPGSALWSSGPGQLGRGLPYFEVPGSSGDIRFQPSGLKQVPSEGQSEMNPIPNPQIPIIKICTGMPL